MQRKTHTIDATKIPLGRRATQTAHLLMGKHKPEYVAYKDCGDSVVVEHFSNIKITGNKLEQKFYYRPTKRPGSLKAESMAKLMQRAPREVLRKAVWGML